MFGSKFLGNTRVPHHKNTADMQPIKMAPPKDVLLLLSQHIGTPAAPVVKVGDEVKVGQLIAESTGYVSSPIHSSVSGKVTKIESYLTSNGKNTAAIRIESDGLMTPAENLAPISVTDLDSLIYAARESGLVGLGGAGFPTAVKFDALKKGIINTVVINGAECEPYITSDTYTMLAESDMVHYGVSLLEQCAPDVERFVFGIENNKPECIHELVRVFGDDSKASVKPLPSRYPQGAEKVLIYNTTGLIVPEGKLPSDVGVLVINVTTLAALAKYVKTGMPLVERCITVDGSAVKEPKKVVAPIGTSVKDILDFAGGIKEDVGKILIGGPMMGNSIHSIDEPITKTTGSIVALNTKDATLDEPTNCIHCGRCVSSCPMFLNPTEFSKALNIEILEERIARLEECHINLCMECGCCSYVCPASRPLVQNNRLGKIAVRSYHDHQSNLK